MDCRGFRPDERRRLVGDPVDVVTGANVLRLVDFTLPGPLPFVWRRYYDSSRHTDAGPLGWGHTHEHDHALRFDLDGLFYRDPVGTEVGFPVLGRDGQEHARDGLTLRRVSARLFQLWPRGGPAMEFAFTDPGRPAPLRRLFLGSAAIEFRYGPHGELREVIDAQGKVVRLDWDGRGQILGLVRTARTPQDKPRALVAYGYDEAGNLVVCADAYGNKSQFQYDREHRLVGRTNRRGFRFHYEYDGQGRCVRSWGDGGEEDTRLRFLAAERATVVTRAGGEWTYLYQEAGVITQVIAPDGGVERFQADGRGQVVAELDANQNRTRFLYDTAGGLIGKLSSLERFTPAGADDPLGAGGPPYRATSPLQWEYGYLLSPVEAASPLGAMPDGVPPFARPFLQSRTPPQDAKEPVRDELGVLLKEHGPGGTARSWSYDANGNPVRYHDRDGSLYQTEYTPSNFPVRTTDPLGNEVLYQWTPTGQLAAVVDPGGTVTEYGYDFKDRLVQVRRHGRVKEAYRYDKADNLIEKRDGEGQTLLTLEIGRHNLPAVRQLASGERQEFVYDDAGQVIQATAGDIQVTLGYDPGGNRTRDLRNGLGIERRFQGLRLAEVCLFKRYRTEYRYDEGVVIRDPGGAEHQLQYLEHGVLLRALSNGTAEVSHFDRAGRCLARVTRCCREPDKPWARVYEHSGEGDLLKIEDSRRGTACYTYDAAHRLSACELLDGTRLAFRHDGAGNLVAQPGLEGVELREGNRLSRANGDDFEYDARNHVAARTGAGGSWRFTYDACDRLTRWERNEAVGEARYDPFGRRVTKSFGGQTTQYYWDEERLAAEVLANGRLRVYVYADDVALVPLVFLEYPDAEADPADGRRYFVFTDQVGTPLRVEDEDGDPAWSACIEPYGTARVDPTSRIDFPLRFPGHYFDAETGLHYNRHRYYSPELGRYLQSDPLGLSGGLNLYAYAASPLAHVDVNGLSQGCGPKQRRDTLTEIPLDGEHSYLHWLYDIDSGHNFEFGTVLEGYIPGRSPLMKDPNPFNHFFPAGYKPGSADFKMHISVHPEHAWIVADVVLPILRQQGVYHKVVENEVSYKDFFTMRGKTEPESDQQGKFITIYTTGEQQKQQVIAAIEPALKDLREAGVPPGPEVTDRTATAAAIADAIARGDRRAELEARAVPVVEQSLGSSGFLSGRPGRD